MSRFLLAAALAVLATVALGLLRILRGPGDAERTPGSWILAPAGWGCSRCCSAITGVGAAVDVALGGLPGGLRLDRFLQAAAPAPSADDSGADAWGFALDVFTAIAIAAGVVFFLAGTVGLLRFPIR